MASAQALDAKAAGDAQTPKESTSKFRIPKKSIGPNENLRVFDELNLGA